jgi:hypothetical protein
MPHLALTRPLGEFYIAYELGNKPRDRVFVFNFAAEGLLVSAQGLHRSIERFQRRRRNCWRPDLVGSAGAAGATLARLAGLVTG